MSAQLVTLVWRLCPDRWACSSPLADVKLAPLVWRLCPARGFSSPLADVKLDCRKCFPAGPSELAAEARLVWRVCECAVAGPQEVATEARLTSRLCLLLLFPFTVASARQLSSLPLVPSPELVAPASVLAALAWLAWRRCFPMPRA